MQSTVVVPTENDVPEAGLHTATTQFPVVVGAKLTVASPESGELSGTLIFPGQLIVGCTGGRVSLIVTVKLQAPPLRVAQLTAVLPIGNADPDGGLQTTLLSGGEPHGPDVVGVAYVATAEHILGSLS